VIDFAPVARFGILLVRPGALLLVGPGLGGQHVPIQARIGLAALLAFALAPSVDIPPGPDAGVWVVVVRELAIGLALGLAARALIAGAELGGHICSQQIGFSYAATIDPDNGARNTALASLYGLLAIFTWLLIGGHHLLLRALHASYVRLPIGAGGLDGSLLASVREVLGVVFVTGLRLAAPVIAVLLLVEVALGLISRAAPALNFFVIGYPVRLAVGLMVVVLTIATVPGLTRSLAERVISSAMTMAGAFR
jgi:flagellar biosynthesis protein FliR